MGRMLSCLTVEASFLNTSQSFLWKHCGFDSVSLQTLGIGGNTVDQSYRLYKWECVCVLFPDCPYRISDNCGNMNMFGICACVVEWVNEWVLGGCGCCWVGRSGSGWLRRWVDGCGGGWVVVGVGGWVRGVGVWRLHLDFYSKVTIYCTYHNSHNTTYLLFL